jgi:amino acid transporter
MNLLLIISVFACALSFHNTINRYFFAIGREGLVWNGFARTHSDHQSPYVAGAVQTAIAWAAAALFALGGADPYAVVVTWMGTLSSIGMLTLQFMVSIAVIFFFRSDARGAGLWSRLLASALSAAGLAGCLALVIANLSLVSGSNSLIVDAFPVLIAAIGVAGIVFAIWIRFMKPALYENLGRAFI